MTAATEVAGTTPAADTGRGVTTLRADARVTAAAPREGTLELGAHATPDGRTIGANSRYLSVDGKPWLPVMGELHYSRVPESQWDDALARVRAAGVDIVASYVIWRHHERIAGQFDWRARRDLRRFVQASARQGLGMVVRIGPWVHAEVRYGGMPEWIVDQMPSRCDDPLYLSFVARFYAQIAAQLQGLLWKDGGPVIGVQLENEYNLTGPHQGAPHIATLRRLARDAGLDVPLYTVTGWDNAVFPHRLVTPVFGGYPDVPWGRSPAMSPPNEVYAFRFTSRVGGDLGAQSHNPVVGDAPAVADTTPFLGAEYGGGVPTMYRRRPVLDADDIAAMLPVQLGSGVNLYGYYMLYGGRNPPDDPSSHESTATGGYNDLPIVNYDFQAPFDGNGEARPVLGKLRPLHYFLREWGGTLAPCAVCRPEVVPHASDDLLTPRFSVRTDGERGFLFFSNHVRQHPMPAHRALRFAVTLPARTVTWPDTPVDVAQGVSFIWPFGLRLGGAHLRHASAQPVTRVPTADGDTYVFGATPGIAPEFAFEAASVRTISRADGDAPCSTRERDGALIVEPAPGDALTLTCAGGERVTILVLAAAEIERLAVVSFDGQPRLVLSAAQVFERDAKLVLRSTDTAAFELAVYPPLARIPRTQRTIVERTPHGLFQRLAVQVEPLAFDALQVTPVRAAQPVPPVATGGVAEAAVLPTPETFAKAAAWRIGLPLRACEAPGVSNVYVSIRYTGDIGRLFCGTTLIDDHFYTGLPWRIGMRHVAIDPDAPLMLTVLPLRADAPLYLDARFDPRPLMTGTDRASLEAVELEAEYEVELI